MTQWYFPYKTIMYASIYSNYLIYIPAWILFVFPWVSNLSKILGVSTRSDVLFCRFKFARGWLIFSKRLLFNFYPMVRIEYIGEMNYSYLGVTMVSKIRVTCSLRDYKYWESPPFDHFFSGDLKLTPAQNFHGTLNNYNNLINTSQRV